MTTQRVTRSQSKALASRGEIPVSLPDENLATPISGQWTATLPGHPAQVQAATGDTTNTAPNSGSINIVLLPSMLTRKTTRLSFQDHKLMLLKQQRLRDLDLPKTSDKQDRFVNRSSSRTKQGQKAVEGEDEAVQRVCAATLIFASDSAGTAVCIGETGLLLTCGHCVAESEEESRPFTAQDGTHLWLLTSSGSVVHAKCVAWDGRRDLALLQVVGAQIESAKDVRFDYVSVASSICKRQTRLCCIGHPGSEDLEAEEAGIATDYPVLAISEGMFLGYAAGQDLQDNSEIGALKHDAWTYWGHSGAPLVNLSDGTLIGLHSSWDDATGTRRGVGVEAINSFLSEAGR